MRFSLKKGRSVTALVLGAALALPTLAMARETRYESLRDEDNFKVTGQAGATAHSGDAAAVTTPGAAYGVQAGFDLTRLFGLEVGYSGAAYQTEQGVEANQFRILENGAQGLASISPNIGMFEPYAFGGVKVNRLSVMEDEAVSALVNDATQVKVPLGVGVNFNINRNGPGDWILGARGTYDATLNSNAFTNLEDSDANAVAGTLLFGGQF